MNEINRNILTRSEAETIQLGIEIGNHCVGGELIGLAGLLGTGKSVLARGIAKGLGITSAVKSPSFNLMREYQGRKILKHWDLYRLDSGFENIGLLQSVDLESVVLVEWAEKWQLLKDLASGYIFINYGDKETERIISWEGNIPGLSGLRCD